MTNAQERACLFCVRGHDGFVMTKRRFLLALAVVLVVAVLVVVFNWERESSEPVYQGRRLSHWVLELPWNVSAKGRSPAEVAVREIGTNALPYLFKWIAYEPAPWRLKAYEVLGKALNRGKNVVFQDRRMLLASGAARGFGVLGKASDATEEALQAMLEDDTNHEVRTMYVFSALMASRGQDKSFVFHLDGLGITSGRFSITFPTNGDPILSVFHTNVPPRLPSTGKTGE